MAPRRNAAIQALKKIKKGVEEAKKDEDSSDVAEMSTKPRPPKKGKNNNLKEVKNNEEEVGSLELETVETQPEPAKIGIKNLKKKNGDTQDLQETNVSPPKVEIKAARPIRSTRAVKAIVEDSDDSEDKPKKKKKGRKGAKKANNGKVPKTEKLPNKEVTNVEDEESVPTSSTVAKKNNTKEPSNQTETVWDKSWFKCKETTEPSYHIMTWNVGDLRALVKKGGLAIFDQAKPDILCIQEVNFDSLPEELSSIKNYKVYWCDSKKKGYAGVGIFTKKMPMEVTHGIDAPEHDDEGRCITAEYHTFFLVNVNVPNADTKLVTIAKRIQWNKAFKSFIKKLDEKKPVIICGNMSVAHNEIDLANLKTTKTNAGFTQEERDGMTDFFEYGFTDTFRRLYPEQTNTKAKNVGRRLDYFVWSSRLNKSVIDNIIHSKVLGSDHCPVSLFYKM